MLCSNVVEILDLSKQKKLKFYMALGYVRKKYEKIKRKLNIRNAIYYALKYCRKIL